jgi:hypothetical protein
VHDGGGAGRLHLFELVALRTFILSVEGAWLMPLFIREITGVSFSKL